jgi:hypothetical protein
VSDVYLSKETSAKPTTEPKDVASFYKAPAPLPLTAQFKEEKYLAALSAVPLLRNFPPGLLPLIASYASDLPKLWGGNMWAMFFTGPELLLFKASSPMAKHPDFLANPDNFRRIYGSKRSVSVKPPRPSVECETLPDTFINQFSSEDPCQIEFMADGASLLMLDDKGILSYARYLDSDDAFIGTGWEGTQLAPAPFFELDSRYSPTHGARIERMRVGAGRFPAYYLVTNKHGVLRGTKNFVRQKNHSSRYTSDGKVVLHNPELGFARYSVMSEPTPLIYPSDTNPRRVVDVAIASASRHTERILLLFNDGTVELAGYCEKSRTFGTIPVPFSSGEKNFSIKSIGSKFRMTSEHEQLVFHMLDTTGGAWVSIVTLRVSDENRIKLTKVNEKLLSNMQRMGTDIEWCHQFIEISSTIAYSVLRCENDALFLYNHAKPQNPLMYLGTLVPDTAEKKLIQVYATGEYKHFASRAHYLHLVYEDGSLLRLNLPWNLDRLSTDTTSDWLLLNKSAAKAPTAPQPTA